MLTPFVYVGTMRLKKGKLDAFEQTCEELVEFVEAREPRLIAFAFYANREGTEASVVQVHPDADSMLFHMQLLREHIAGVGGKESPIDATTSSQVYGAPNAEVLETIRQLAPGVPLVVKPDPLGGFVRSGTKEAVAAS